jgi:succinate-semialdehyde dehydrogenase / glutarate-semialdehyde dehydrogenase
MSYIISTNPSQGYKEIGSVLVTSESEIVTLVEQSRSAQKKWGLMSVTERVSLLRDAYEKCMLSKEILARSISNEMGMPIRLARDEVQYGLNYFLWYLDNAEKYLSPEVTFENETEIHTVFYEAK